MSILNPAAIADAYLSQDNLPTYTEVVYQFMLLVVATEAYVITDGNRSKLALEDCIAASKLILKDTGIV